jgi:hypothetical protein
MGILVDQQYSGGVINIYQNIIHNNCRGISLYNYYFNSEARVFIYNNVCYKNDNLNPYGLEINSYELDIQVEPRILKIKNNIFYHTSGHAVIVSWSAQNAHSDFTCDYNCFYKTVGANDPKFAFYNGRYITFAEWCAATGGDSNSIVTNPIFVDIQNNNVHLHVTSPCIDAGTDVGIIQDLEGNIIPQGNGPDIGAFEYRVPIKIPSKKKFILPYQLLQFNSRSSIINMNTFVKANSGNYPNPFNSTTSISFDLPFDATVKVHIFNTVGQKIDTLLDGIFPIGNQQITWNAVADFGNHLPSGIYFYRIEIRSKLIENHNPIVITKKMVLME